MADNTVSPSRNTVVIGCKYPSGIVLEIDEVLSPDDGRAANTAQGGIMGTRTFFPSGKRVVLNGANSIDPRSPQYGEARAIVGVGLTDVPADFWEAWAKQHKDYPPLKNGTLFMVPNQAAAAEEAKIRRDVKTGQERLDPTKPGPRLAPDNGKAI